MQHKRLTLCRGLLAALFAVGAAQAQTGQLRLCKNVGSGVTATTFNFTVNGVTQTVTAGNCTTTSYPSGTAISIQEAAVSGLSVTSITSSGELQSQDLVNRTASLHIGGNTTTVTYTNSLTATLGTLRICKIAGTGITSGTPYRFTVTGSGINDTMTVAAGAAPGTCSNLQLPAGTTVLVTEAEAEDSSVSGITGGTGANMTARNVSATITANGVTTVTFTNIASATGECGPGYYKNNLSGSLATKKLSDYFAGLPPELASESLQDALGGGGGSGVTGALRIMLRSAVVGLLDSMNTNLHYQYTTAQVIQMVNTAIASNNRQTILALSAQFNAANGSVGGCPSGTDDDNENDSNNRHQTGGGRGRH